MPCSTCRSAAACSSRRAGARVGGSGRGYAIEEVVEDDAGFLTDQPFDDAELAGTGDVHPIDATEFAAVWARAGTAGA